MATVTRETHLKENPYEVARAQLRRIADVLGLDESLVRVLERCKKGVVVAIPTRMDDGRMEVFEGYRVQHNLARGPSKGGIRYHPDCQPRRGAGAGDVDDLEVRPRRHPLRRRQGRRHGATRAASRWRSSSA